jgi:type I restriction enzyme S subunit
MTADPVTTDVAAPLAAVTAIDSAPSDLPRGWAWATIGAFAEVIGGSTPPRHEPRYFGGDIIWLTPTEVPKETVSVLKDSREHLTEAGFKASGVRWIPEGSILLTSRASIGYTAIAGTCLTTNQGFASFVVSGGFEAKYLAWWLKSEKSNLEGLAGGTTFKEISKTVLKTVSVPIPPLAEQRRIVAAIEQQFTRLDAGVAALRRAQTALKRYRAAVLKAAVEGRLTDDWRRAHPDAEPAATLLARILAERRARWEANLRAKGKDPARPRYPEPAAPDTASLPALPDGWCWATVDQIGEIQGGIQKQPSRTPKDHAYPYLRVANVLRGRLDLSEIEHMELFGSELETLRLAPGDLLIVEGNGSRTEIGRSAMWTGEIDDCVHQNHIIRVRSREVLAKYLNYFWNSPDGSEQVMRVAGSTSGLYTLSISKISKLPVPLPPLAEQQAIVAEVERRLSVVAEMEAAVAANLARAERLRQAILREAFAGRLVPQDPGDEPASALLERIRGERGQSKGRNSFMAQPQGNLWDDCSTQ